jgi:hypothetical protein
MRSLQLRSALTEFVHEAGGALAAALASGAEVRFELESQHARGGVRGAGSVLYAYRALTDEFVAEHEPELMRLASYAPAAGLLSDFDGLERYLASAGAELEPERGRGGARAAMLALVQEVFRDQTDFELRAERLQGALDRLESSTLAGAGETTLVATLHGLTISSPELRLTRGLTIAHPHGIDGLPEAAVAGAEEHLVVVLGVGDGEAIEAIGRGRAVLKDLLRALRLFGDGRVTLGALAWARVGQGRWGALALGTGGRPHGMLVVTAEQEDELRAFCNLVSRRAPDGNELAWALRRFELGCERLSPFEALSDHLMALRVLLEPEGPASGLLAGRLAALCATPEQRAQLNERALAALALEREAIAGTACESAASLALAEELADHLRALLRDVICGHLDANLVGLADELLLAGAADEHACAPVTAEVRAPQAPQPASLEQILGDAGEAQEILDVFI